MRGLIGTALLALCVAPVQAQVWGEVALETRLFPAAGLYPGQAQLATSLMVNPRFDHMWANGRQSLVVELFGRLDRDAARTHVDVRQLAWEYAADAWELRVGLRRVFWGVSESQHLVDVINQTDLVEDPDGEDKLGQPMLNFAWIRSWGTLDLYVLPGFRERTFPGRRGRLRPGILIDEDRVSFASRAGRSHVELAVRWSHHVGAWDIGVSHFRGTGREPTLVPVASGEGSMVLAPHYPQIDQTGLDAQFTKGGWLGKIEAILRDDSPDRFAAATAGFEYTFGTVLGTSADLGVLGEYLWDERGSRAPSSFENDIFVGARLALNDVQSTQLLAGAIVDNSGDGVLLRVEGSRRLGERWTTSLRALALIGIPAAAPFHGIRRDDYLEVGLSRHF